VLRYVPTCSHTLISSFVGNGRFFGFSVSVSGDSLAVGDPKDNFEYKRNQVRMCVCVLRQRNRMRERTHTHTHTNTQERERESVCVSVHDHVS
jgi:hypothetical protein